MGVEERFLREEQIRVIRSIRIIRKFSSLWLWRLEAKSQLPYFFGLAARSRSSARSPAPLVKESSA